MSISNTFRTTDLIVDNQVALNGTGVFNGSYNQKIATTAAGAIGMTLDASGTNGNDVQLIMKYNGVGHVGEAVSINNFMSCTMDTTAGAVQAIGVQSNVSSTKSAGANTLTNVAFEAEAGGGDVNYSFLSVGGADMRNDGPASFGATLTTTLTTGGAFANLSGSTAIVLNDNVSNFKVPGSSSANPRIGVGTQQTDGTQIQIKNTNTSGTLTGMDIGIDTTVNSAVRGGLLIYRGAGGGFGGAVEGGLVIAAASGFPFNGTAANNLGLFHEGGDIDIGADTGFNISAKVKGDATGDIILAPGTPGLGLHLRTQGAAVAFSSCGSGPACNSTTCSDIAGTFTVGSGSTTCTITFAKTYTGADDAGCVISPIGIATLPTFTTTATTIAMSVAIASTKYHYICLGH